MVLMRIVVCFCLFTSFRSSSFFLSSLKSVASTLWFFVPRWRTRIRVSQWNLCLVQLVIDLFSAFICVNRRLLCLFSSLPCPHRGGWMLQHTDGIISNNVVHTDGAPPGAISLTAMATLDDKQKRKTIWTRAWNDATSWNRWSRWEPHPCAFIRWRVVPPGKHPSQIYFL